MYSTSEGFLHSVGAHSADVLMWCVENKWLGSSFVCWRLGREGKWVSGHMCKIYVMQT